MLFNFTLRPLDQVAPWGRRYEPLESQVHWDDLTDGEYWIEAGDCKLFEYTTQVQASQGATRYCRVYVVRPYEDILSRAPHILEAVPPSLIRYISGECGRAWLATARQWIAESTAQNENRRCAVYMQTASWISARKLDDYFLLTPPHIHFWSDESAVHIEWNNVERKLDGQPAWSATWGFYRLSRDDFMREVRSFHRRLMEQMWMRIEQVAAGQLPAECTVDLRELEREQIRREGSLAGRFSPPEPATDWERIRSAIRLVAEHVC